MVWKYIDTGWMPGVPARDITDDEAKTLGITHVLKASNAYEHLSDSEHPRIAARAEKAAGNEEQD